MINLLPWLGPFLFNKDTLNISKREYFTDFRISKAFDNESINIKCKYVNIDKSEGTKEYPINIQFTLRADNKDEPDIVKALVAGKIVITIGGHDDINSVPFSINISPMINANPFSKKDRLTLIMAGYYGNNAIPERKITNITDVVKIMTPIIASYYK